MKSLNKYYLKIFILVLVLVFNTKINIFGNTNEPVNNDEVKIQEINTGKNRSPNDWTFLVYLDADNNLESAGIDDFLEMSSVGSDANIHIVVQFDRTPGYDPTYDDWTTTKRYYITPGMTPTTDNAIEDLGEVNMGSPAILSDFITWGTVNYPATHYALILWDHGAGWKYSSDSNEVLTKAVCYDDTSFGDSLTLEELESALSTAGETINLLGFDACLMGMAEVDYQIKDWADVRVGSEEVEPGDGWPYNTILSDLRSTPTMSPTMLGQIIVNRYIESYPGATIESQSAVDLTQEDTLASAVDNFAQVLINGINLYRIEMGTARSASEESFYVPEFIDLYDFAYEINTRISNITIQNAAQDVMNNISSIIIAEQHGSSHPDFHGITIYFPQTLELYDSDYETMLDFTIDLIWDEFLQAYYGNMPDDEYEENDNSLSAYNISLYEQTWLSSIDGLGIQADDDWYEIEVTPGNERLVVNLQFSDSEGDIDLEIYDIGVSFIAGSYSVTDNEYLNYVLPSDGTYYLLVYYGDAGNAYDLWWDDQDPGGGSEDAYEENDDLLSAFDISSEEQTWLSSLLGQGIQADDDWYEIYVTFGYEHLIVNLTFSNASGNIDIDIYDSSGFFVIGNNSLTDNETINFILPTGGIYYINIYGNDAGNNYDMWWDDLSYSGVGDDNYEQNDYYWEAFDLSSYENVWLSSINGPGIQADDDWYEIYVSLGNLHLHVDLIFSDAEGDIDIDVYDSYGALITYGWSITDNEYIDYVLPLAGIYYLCVNWGDAGNSYDLKWYITSTDGGDGGGGGGGDDDDDDDIFELIPGYDLSILIGSMLVSVAVVSIFIIRKWKRNYRK